MGKAGPTISTFALVPRTEMRTTGGKSKPSDPSKSREGSGTRKFNPKGCATRPVRSTRKRQLDLVVLAHTVLTAGRRKLSINLLDAFKIRPTRICDSGCIHKSNKQAHRQEQNLFPYTLPL